MSERIPVVSGREMVRILERLGYTVVRQKGSHVRLRHPDLRAHAPTTVPLHRELTRGTLLSILADARLTVEQFRKARREK